MGQQRLIGSDGRLRTWDRATPIHGMGGTGTREFGLATTANRAAAEALRDAYFSGPGAAHLAQYNANRNIFVRLVWTGNGEAFTRRNMAGTAWEDSPADEIAEGAWVEVVEKAAAMSAFGALQAGDFWYNASTDTERTPARADVYRYVEFADLADVVSYDLTLDQPLVDTTALADEVQSNRFGRAAFSGSVTGISNIREIDVFLARAAAGPAAAVHGGREGTAQEKAQPSGVSVGFLPRGRRRGHGRPGWQLPGHHRARHPRGFASARCPGRPAAGVERAVLPGRGLRDGPHADALHGGRLMRLTVQRTVTFVPPFRDNEKLPESQQIAVEIQVPTAAEWAAVTHRGPNDPLPVAALLRDHVPTVRNLSVQVDGEVQEITDGEALGAQPSLGLLGHMVLMRLLAIAAVPDPT